MALGKGKLVFFLVATLLFSCKEKSSIEGDWVLAYYITKDLKGKETKKFHCAFLTIKNSEWKTFQCKRPDMGIGSKELTHNFIKRGNKIYQEDYPEFKAEIVLIAQDSMVIDYNELDEQFSVVYKKLPRSSELKIEPKNQSFKFSGNNGVAFFEFLNDSLMVEYAQNSKDFSWKKWWIESFEGHEFLILNQIPEPQPIHIDTIAEDFIKISTLDTESNSYELTPILKNTELLNNIQGSWELSTESTINSQIPPPPLDIFFDFQKIEISKTSVILNEGQNPAEYQWFLSKNSKTLFLFTTNSRVIRTWEVTEITDQKLILDMPVLSLERSGIENPPRVIREYTRYQKY